MPLSVFQMANSQNTNDSASSAAEFEFQEMRVQLQAMAQQGIPSRDLIPTKRAELESYVRKVVQERASPVPLAEIGERLLGTEWLLVFSTQGAALADLPRDAKVLLEFDQEDLKLDYVLEFSKKTMGLNRLTAKSTYTFDDGPINPGLVTFVYDQIKTDAFGFNNLSVGFFGLLKGRANYVESSFYDGQFWIERAFGPDGMDYYNVYIKQGGDERF
mmetsp:Transcript_8722/g.12337  ORF Transcript_8722/g.12337 Transcript_8722/m.12337 type:complete len:216 (-) Transcript_8722:287-934(-)